MTEISPSPALSREPLVMTTKTEGKRGSLTVVFKEDESALTKLAQVGALPNRLMLLTVQDAFKNPDERLARELFSRWKDVPWNDDILVRVGFADLPDDAKRMLSSSMKGGKTDLFARVAEQSFRLLAEAQTLRDIGKRHALFGKLRRDPRLNNHARQTLATRTMEDAATVAQLGYTRVYGVSERRDWYDPAARTATILSPNLASAMHEMGHALDFDRRAHPSVHALLHRYLPFGTTTLEWNASKNALERMDDPEEKKRAAKVLEPAFAQTVGEDINSVARAALPFVENPALRSAMERWRESLPYVLLGVGHAATRMPGRKGAFGWVFEGKRERVRPLTPGEEPQVPASGTSESRSRADGPEGYPA